MKTNINRNFYEIQQILEEYLLNHSGGLIDSYQVGLTYSKRNRDAYLDYVIGLLKKDPSTWLPREELHVTILPVILQKYYFLSIL